MKKKIIMELKKRREARYQYYFSSIGDTLKSRRLSLAMTQEEVSLGICSNTYLSKVENNQIPVNIEQLNMIMEKMNIPIEEISFPAEMFADLEESVRLFFYKDVDNYKKLLKKVENYQLSFLYQVINLGYFLLIDDYEQAGEIFNRGFRYLSSLEELGFSVFMIYISLYCVGIRNYKLGKDIIDLFDNMFINDDFVFCLYNFTKFIIYGNLELRIAASESGYMAINIFNKYCNLVRINEYFVWREIFNIYDGNFDETRNHLLIIQNISDNLKNLYLAVLASASHEPTKYLPHFSHLDENYLLGLFLNAKYHLENNNQEDYKELLDLINSLHYKLNSKIDYGYILKLIKKNEEIFLKDYLINYVLPLAKTKHNLYFMRMVTNQITKILHSKKRYKDALTYQNKLNNFIEKLKTKEMLVF